MPKFRFNVTQQRTQTWVVEVESDSEEDARETVLYGFDDVEGTFIEDTEGLTVLEDDGDYEGLQFLDMEEVV